ncbi:MAG: hypothetical protein GKC05_06170 [Methanomicrobiales archaeon]|nr:hypothetical protein [Methanomicrobiales archaeon]
MRVPGKIDHEEGLLSIDFIIGFTIFMVALIFVAIMISGLLVHLQSRTIDYDAVAYRTSVVLVEDPGEPSWEPWSSGRPMFDPPNWHLVNISRPVDRERVKRLGLAISKYYPGILQYHKVQKFFSDGKPPSCSGKDQFCVPDDYTSRLIFGDYPYKFNITIRSLDPAFIYNESVGPSTPTGSGYGYIKRIVKIKQPSYLIIHDGNATGFNNTTVHFNFSENYGISPLYRIDSINENITVNFTGLPSGTTISSLRVCVQPPFLAETCYSGLPTSPTFYSLPPISDGTNVTIPIVIEAGFFYKIGLDEFSDANLTVRFNQQAVNSSVYEYNTATIPNLTPAVVEVKVW